MTLRSGGGKAPGKGVVKNYHSLIVLSLNLFGDGLRDAFDPKLKR